MTYTAMCWGVECGDGWYPLVRRLCQALSCVTKLAGGRIVATQVKEKYGTLRFYWDSVGLGKDVWDAVDKAVSLAEEESAKTCELCGQPGTMRDHYGWCSVRCDECEGKEP